MTVVPDPIEQAQAQALPDWRAALENIDADEVFANHAECSTDGFCPTCQDNWRGRPGCWAVDFDSPKHGTVTWPCLPFLLARRLQDAEQRVESQAVDLSRLREERDALTTLAMSFFDPSPCSFDHHGGCQNHTFLDLEPGELCPNEQLRRLPPVAPSPDPNGGEQ